MRKLLLGRKPLMGLAAAATVGLAAAAVPGTANAHCFGCEVGAGVIGGMIGAALGSAVVNSPPPPAYYYPPPPPPPPPPTAYYPPPPPAYAPGYAEIAPGCYWARRRVWIERVGYRWRTVEVCR